jgi:hypothetical protein
MAGLDRLKWNNGMFVLGQHGFLWLNKETNVRITGNKALKAE